MSGRTWRRRLCVGLLSIAAGLVGFNAHADTLYRWNDANGNPVVSDRPPPPGTAYTTLDGRRYGVNPTKPRANDPAFKEKRDDGDVLKGKGGPKGTLLGEGQSLAEDFSPEPATNAQCAQIKDDIFKLETFARLRAVDPESGDMTYMSDVERETRLKQARKFQEERCKQ